MNTSSGTNVDINMNTVEPFTSSLTVEADHLVTCDRVPNGLRTGLLPQQLHGHDVKLITEPKSATSRPSHPDEQRGDGSYTKLKTCNRSDRGTSPPNKENNIQEQKDEAMAPGEESEDDNFDDEESNEALCQRACLVKLYARLKEELTRSSARAIAGYLYQHKDRLLSAVDYERICHCSWRRQAVEQLLKKIVKGCSSMYSVFLEALKDQDDGHLAKEIHETCLSEEEVNLFSELEAFSLDRCDQRPNSHQPRFTLSSADYSTLVYYLNCKNAIDCLNDKFLSSFLFSIREHTNVCLHSMNEEGRIKQLLDTMKLCEEAIFDVLCKGLIEQSMPNVIKNLEKALPDGVKLRGKKRSRSCDEVDASSQDGERSTAKRQRVTSAAEVRAVTSLANNPDSELRQHVNEEIGFDIEHVNKGSIVIQLCPKKADSWQKLKSNCLSGNIKEFIPKVYSDDDVKDLLQEGEYRLQFTIYVLPAPKHLQDQKKIMFHLETETEKIEAKSEEAQSTENPIEDCMDLLVEELEICKELLTLLKKEGIVQDSIKEELDKQTGRAKKNKFLLKQIAEHGRKGYDILKSYIKDDNEDLYKELVTKEKITTIGDSLPQAAKVTKGPAVTPTHSVGSHKRELFFKGTVVLKVKKSLTKENIDPESQLGSHMEITCPEIIDPICYFSDNPDVEVPTKDGELTMVLEEAWSTVGASSPKREIKIGKRKLVDKCSGKKKKHSHSQDDNDSDDTADLVQRKGKQPTGKQSTGDEKGESQIKPKDKNLDEKDRKETKEPD